MKNINFQGFQHSSNWNLKRSNLQKEYYPAITEADLDFEEQNEQLMLENIQKKLGKSVAELKRVMDKNSPNHYY